jgi:hypothetical protein
LRIFIVKTSTWTPDILHESFAPNKLILEHRYVHTILYSLQKVIPIQDEKILFDFNSGVWTEFDLTDLISFRQVVRYLTDYVMDVYGLDPEVSKQIALLYLDK